MTMPTEIECKFLVSGNYQSSVQSSLRITQGYLNSNPERTVRVRIKGDKGFMTIKGQSDISGTTRFEWEKEISVDDVQALLPLCEPGVIDKTRHLIPCGQHTYEVDEFHGDNQGLIVAEIELSDAEEAFEKPDWLGEEVTGRPEYYNSSLSSNPFINWPL